jgi:hypothetical protein
MATRKPETGTETKVSSVEQDAAAPETVVADVQTEGDPRESALAALVYGNSTPATVVTPETELVVDESEVLDFGGRSKAVVLFSYYNQFVDGVVRSAKKGQVIKTDADSLARGVRIGALKKISD